MALVLLPGAVDLHIDMVGVSLLIVTFDLRCAPLILTLAYPNIVDEVEDPSAIVGNVRLEGLVVVWRWCCSTHLGCAIVLGEWR